MSRLSAPHDTPTRCSWCGDDPLYVAYHDKEWGVPLHDEQKLFEFLLLEGVQAGLSWITVLRKREAYRIAFDNFDPEKIARYTPAKVEKLMQNQGIIRNRLKIESAIHNAKVYLAMKKNGESLNEFLWSFVDGKPIQNKLRGIQDAVATTPESDAMSKALKKKGFKFVGSTICYALMQAAGMVNDHFITCFRYRACADLASGDKRKTRTAR
ncbi:DNA-3-methyladenine glycosylase I [Cellvibrio japonicus]|uniref:DNA-3-methyladenine glycosylase I n=1 Tax=Cellvibrio japonicus (strain Ueda107) TaxID=498211 RepID=B3PHR6_CELJU|nr:DNA-3-methyladenine glycosylase I [Cellvibrio japonicus]ACE84278.1 DNA-3-methyladenine glycosylase I [Cellvibrio japonicus Ueda107]QEI13862.1 DNA-3-methyladenine glycosylase I [Cellvibrio japonicus]QEI17436.1 DNA-3-methyladenine glycosylase I [Cellvibrio japonicus]QEI21012.1 DNA-3-methyladenine glycosylase I [Cellvibrio japonicus]